MSLRTEVKKELLRLYGCEDDARRVFRVHGSARPAVASIAKKIVARPAAAALVAAYLDRRRVFRDGLRTWQGACRDARDCAAASLMPPDADWRLVRTAVATAEALLGPLPRDRQVKCGVRVEFHVEFGPAGGGSF